LLPPPPRSTLFPYTTLFRSLYYHSFIETIAQASSWTQGTLLEIRKAPIVIDVKKREPGVDLVVIDPVDPDRNLAAAVRPDRLWRDRKSTRLNSSHVSISYAV